MIAWRSFKKAGVIALGVLAAAAPAARVEASWSLVWADEFNGTTLDTGSWTVDTGTGCPNLCGWGNSELEYYLTRNVSVSGGNLVLTAKAESYGGASFTSGKIHTRGKRTVLYGRVEMRARLPVGGGMWPAFWMMPESDVYGGWAASGEIDIMEAANAMTSVGGTIHFGGQWPNNTYSTGSHSLGGGSFADGFHVYAVEWDPDEIRWYVDGTLYFSRTSSQWYSDGAPGDARAPFDQPFYILLNLAVGGNYTGCTDPGCVGASFPQQYLVDYVRVYEDIPNALPTVAITSPAWGADLPAGDVTVTADASDPDGTVASVEFYDGSNYLGADATAPYSFTWSAVPDGCYQLTARALDNLGGEATDAVEITVGAGCGRAPYHGTPFALPARIEAEDYDDGGEGVAYHDQDASNNGGQYRAGEGVDLEACSDAGGGYDVGWTNAGEWLEYTIEVPAAGAYTLDTRVASESSGGAFRVEVNGVDKTGTLTVPVTGAWQNWTTVSTPVELAAGTQTLRVAIESAGFNLNYLAFSGDAGGVAGGGVREGYTLSAGMPNPFTSSTVIRYTLPGAGAVHLDVYDVSGRLIRSLVRGEWMPAGAGRATWDGRDGSGRRVRSGVYFYRLDAGGISETKRVTVVR